MKWFTTQIALLGAVTAIAAGACYLTKSDPAYTGEEKAPCTGNADSLCARFVVCPQGIVCDSTWYTGWKTCFPATITVPARDRWQGIVNPATGCCVGGVDIGPSGTVTCTIPWDTVGGQECLIPFPG